MELDIEKLYEIYREDVFSFLRRMSGDADLADDLTQETFYQAYISMDRFDGRSHIRTWLFSIAKNLFFAHLRKDRSLLRTENAERILGNILDEQGDPEAKVIGGELLESLMKRIFSMNENMKRVFLARVFSAESYKKISADMKISESSAKVLFHRAKKYLREKLKEEDEHEI